MIFQILIPLLTAVMGFFLGIVSFNYTFRKQQKNTNQKDKLTKLLLPLYIRLKQIDAQWPASLVSDNYGPPDFLEDLPKTVESLIPTIKEYLYLADKDFIRSAVDFIKWVEVNTVDAKRFDKIMENKIAEVDQPFLKFKKKVYKLFEEEHKKFLKEEY